MQTRWGADNVDQRTTKVEGDGMAGRNLNPNGGPHVGSPLWHYVEFEADAVGCALRLFAAVFHRAT
jgi:hypothetical protein